MTDRVFRALVGAVAIVLFLSSVILGAKVANGLLKNTYTLNASFTAAGQGLGDGSDVKIHGVNVGRVKHVTLVKGRALVHMEINGDQKIPVASQAIIRPKTLFGEKFVDIEPGSTEATGPFLKGGQRIRNTLGGYELEKVLTDLYPILKAIKPEQLGTIVSTLADGGQGEGPAINRTLVNLQALAAVQAAHAADTQEFLDDFATISSELDKRAADIVAGANSLNAALPVINDRGDELATVLDEGGRLAHDLADVLENNRPFLQKAATEGGQVVQTLYDQRDQLPGLVTGIREFVEVLAEVSRIPFGDGTNLAAVKLILGGSDCPAGRGLLTCAPATGPQPINSAATRPPGGQLAKGVPALTAMLERMARVQ